MIRTETTFRLEVDTIRDIASFSSMEGVKNFSHTDDISKNRTHLTFILEDEGPVAEILSTITSQGKKVHSYKNPSRPSKTGSSAWAGGGSSETGHPPPHGLPVPDRP